MSELVERLRGKATDGHADEEALYLEAADRIEALEAALRAGTREALALALYAKWIVEADGDADFSQWTAEAKDDWQHDRPLNPVGLAKKSFLEEADWLLNLIQPMLAALAPEQDK